LQVRPKGRLAVLERMSTSFSYLIKGSANMAVRPQYLWRV